MENENIYDIIKSNGCIEGGIYEAYIKAREVISNSFVLDEDKLMYFRPRISMQEFIESVKILMAFASKHQDEYVELYDCDITCKYFKMHPCPVECIVSDNATKRCPFYQSDNI